MDIQNLNHVDPVKKQPEQGMGGNEMSPMDPPEAYSPPAMDKIPLEERHPFLRKLGEEHVAFLEELKNFDEAILSVQKTGFTKELDGKLRHFFHFFDHDFTPHNRREERILFPLLNERLIADGEHSPIGARPIGARPIEAGKTEAPATAIDIMEEEHLKAVQLAAVILNFMGLSFRLPDEKSRLIVLDAALEQGKNLVELLRLHIFREDNIVFSSAHRLISKTEFDRMQSWNRT